MREHVRIKPQVDGFLGMLGFRPTDLAGLFPRLAELCLIYLWAADMGDSACEIFFGQLGNLCISSAVMTWASAFAKSLPMDRFLSVIDVPH